MKLSLVIPSMNQRPFLAQTLRQIFQQEVPVSLQVFVADGGSNDGTVELLQSFEDPRLTWISEPDRGQSHAINKGIARVSGDLVGWINSDDLYTDHALSAVAEAFAAHPEAQWLVGRVEIIDQQGSIIRSGVTRYKDARLRRYSRRSLLRENFISQMGVFWRRSFGDEVAYPDGKLLDESLHYSMDYDLWLRMGERCDPLILDRVLAQFRLYPASKSGAVNREQFDEQYRVACRYFQGDTVSRAIHRFNVEKIVWAYRVLRLLGR